MLLTKQELTEQLMSGVYNVTFTKVDGTERTMPCTLKESILPPAKKEDPLSQKKVRAINDEVLVVYCTDKNEWRSFRLANVISVQSA
jgi:Na+-translocating ferredoxin:NAD+ oxidoreductase RnfG subunit|tara:strand:+ start:445 stop:705 length:261 start_codon:yes stop_codon:yes gene_type:complete